MMHSAELVDDSFETLCSEPNIRLERYVMKRTSILEDLKFPGEETLVVPMQGSAELRCGATSFDETLLEKDFCYIPIGETFSIEKRTDSAEVVLARAPGRHRYNPYIKRFSDTKPIEGGAPTYRRLIYNIITESDSANRFLGGFVKGEKGNWGGFPPHKHDGKPEVYVYYGMGKGFAVQLVMTQRITSTFVVRDGDAVYFNRGYHPCVATPGSRMNFLWIISANPKSRNLAVSIHPDFVDMPIGKTHLKLD